MKNTFYIQQLFSRRSYRLWYNVEIYCRLEQATADNIQGGSNMTGTDLCVNKCKQSRSYLNHPVIWDTRFACWITKATDIYSLYVIIIALPSHNGYANAPPCYVDTTLRVSLCINWSMIAYKYGREREIFLSNGSDDIRNQRGEENLIFGIFLMPQITGAHSSRQSALGEEWNPVSVATEKQK